MVKHFRALSSFALALAAGALAAIYEEDLGPEPWWVVAGVSVLVGLLAWGIVPRLQAAWAAFWHPKHDRPKAGGRAAPPQQSVGIDSENSRWRGKKLTVEGFDKGIKSKGDDFDVDDTDLKGPDDPDDHR